MGLRTASVRHSNAVVMAPALTEAGQSKKFNLPPSSPINNVSKNDGYNSQDENQQQMCKNGLKFKCAYPNGQIDVTDENYCIFPPVTDSNKKATVTDQLHKLQQFTVASENSNQPFQQPDIIMNTSPTHMGDQNNKMGLQKTGMDAMTLLLKEKNLPNDVEQLLNNLTGVLPPAADLTGAGGDLTQNVDDLIQVWNAAAIEDTENVQNSDVRTQRDGLPEAMFPLNFARDLFDVDMNFVNAVDVDNLCQPQVDVREQRAKDLLEELQKRHLKLERRTEFCLRRLRKNQTRYMSKHVSEEIAGFLEYVQRTFYSLKKSATTTTTTSSSSAVGALVASNISDLDNSNNDSINNINDDYNVPSTSSAEFTPKPMDSVTLNSFLSKLQTTVAHQSCLPNRQKYHSIAKYFDTGLSEQSTSSSRNIAARSSILSRLPIETGEELERVAGSLQTELSLVESQFDSDATASSSGAESCDEMLSYNNPHQQTLPISKRASWKYACDRAQVASRWSWLQAQISDLEYRIRQYNELHRQIRACKGAVILGDNHPQPQQQRCSGTVQTATTLTSLSPSAVNGYRGQLPGATGKATDDLANGAVVSSPTVPTTSNSPASAASSTVASIAAVSPVATATAASAAAAGTSSCRTRPLNRASFRKRKLLQTTGLHTVSKKASRPSTIRCGCDPSVVPCALCTGRTDPTYPRDSTDQLTMNERIALIDPGFHSILSFPEDESWSVHAEALIKHPDWQQKSLRFRTLKGALTSAANKVESPLERQPANNNNNNNNTTIVGADNNRPNKKLDHRKRYNNRFLKHDMKNRMGRGRRPFRGVSGTRLKKRLAGGQLNSGSGSGGAGGGAQSESMDELEMMESQYSPASYGYSKGGSGAAGGGGGGGGHESLTPSPLSHVVQVVPYRRNRSIDSYDIDNIVIPYSVAASTRVEKLQYKEILTPKWRVIDNDFASKCDNFKNNGIVRRQSEDSDNEDVSDDAVRQRHDKCEHEEKKKFLSYIQFPLTGRSRANRRTDSRAESSGANTPDPMSPHAINNADVTVGSPMMSVQSPPPTPVSMITNNSSSSNNNNNNGNNDDSMPPTTSTAAAAVTAVTSAAQTTTALAAATPGIGTTTPPPAAAVVATSSMVQPAQQQPQSINAISSSGGSGSMRRRTISHSRWAAHNREERCTSPDQMAIEIVPPYEPRQFPFSDEVYEKMLKLMPEGHLQYNHNNNTSSSNNNSNNSNNNSGTNTLANSKQSSRGSDITDRSHSRPDTPISDSTESLATEEDPNDPEWVQQTERTNKR